MKLTRLATAALLVGALFALPACTSSEKSDPAKLVGVEWKLVSSGDNATDLGAIGITAKFNGKKVSGFSGVNQYGGPYTAGDDGSFSVGELASTLMAGAPAAMEAERVYMARLDKCDRYKVADGKLTLYTGDEASLVYEEAKPVQLPGTTWAVTGYNNGKQAVVSVALDSTMTIEFGADETVSGNSGVNTYNGPCTIDGATIAMGPFATTKMAGPESLMTQEAQFLAALANGTKWSVERNTLEIRDDQGALQVTAVSKP